MSRVIVTVRFANPNAAYLTLAFSRLPCLREIVTVHQQEFIVTQVIHHPITAAEVDAVTADAVIVLMSRLEWERSQNYVEA